MAVTKHLTNRVLILVVVTLVLLRGIATESLSNSTSIYDLGTTSETAQRGVANLVTETENMNESQVIMAPGKEIYSHFGIMILAQQLFSYRVAKKLEAILTPTLSIVGVIGNILSGIVMFRKNNRQVSCYFYMAMLAVTDSLHLITTLGYWIVKDTPHLYVPPNIYKWICYILFPITSGSALCGTYIILAMTLDRLIAVKWPLKSLTWCTMKRARVTTACAITFSFLVKLPYAWITKSLPTCVPFQMKRTPLVDAYYWINSSLTCYIPFTILLTFNLLIIASMRNRGKYFKKDRSTNLSSIEMTKQTVADSNTSVTEYQSKTTRATLEDVKESRIQTSMTRTLLLITFSFLLLSSPIHIYYLIYLFVSPYTSPDAFAQYATVGIYTSKLSQLNYAINFYIYCLGGSQFRTELRKLFSAFCKN